jgi:alkyl sulfatase BDS1-like metallo-beta-lactamase superfamily hydrolase
VQRYPDEWAEALRAMAALSPELILPAHGLPIEGGDRIGTVLTTTADALEALVEDTLTMMNDGCRLDEIIETVKVPPTVLDLPYLRPTYDEPEFIVRNIWRLYGGWYDGNPAHLKPSPDAALARALAVAAGGARKLADQAEVLCGDGELSLACELAEFAWRADPDDERTRGVRAAVYRERARSETSLMAKGIYKAAARDVESDSGD